MKLSGGSATVGRSYWRRFAVETKVQANSPEVKTSLTNFHLAAFSIEMPSMPRERQYFLACGQLNVLSGCGTHERWYSKSSSEK